MTNRPYQDKSTEGLKADRTYWKSVQQTDAGAEMQNFAHHRIREIDKELACRRTD